MKNKNKNKNKYLVSNDLNNPLLSSVFLMKCVNNYSKNIPDIFGRLNVEERKKFVDSLQSIRYFNALYAYNKENQECFHVEYDPNFSKSGYLNKPLSMIVPFLYSENLIKK